MFGSDAVFEKTSYIEAWAIYGIPHFPMMFAALTALANICPSEAVTERSFAKLKLAVPKMSTKTKPDLAEARLRISSCHEWNVEESERVRAANGEEAKVKRKRSRSDQVLDEEFQHRRRNVDNAMKARATKDFVKFREEAEIAQNWVLPNVAPDARVTVKCTTMSALLVITAQRSQASARKYEKALLLNTMSMARVKSEVTPAK
jgi:hypothetical protein